MCAASNTPPRPIETFVFLDLEATGLPSSRPKIAEICLFSVNRYALENPEYSNSFPKPVPIFPRVIDKLSICINPDKPFTPTASSITGLRNEAFASNKKQSFNIHILHIMAAFFGRQHPPVCLVAHNGFSYDFPLLKAELSTLGISSLDELYCADTIKAMRALDNENSQHHQFAYRPLGSKKKYSLCDLYFKFYNIYPLNSHSAEGDVITLIRVFQQRARDLMCWMDLNAKQFKTVKAMYKENERCLSFSQISENVQLLPPSFLQLQPQRRTGRACSNSLYPVDDDTGATANEYNSISDLRAEIKNMLLLFTALIIITWIALKNSA